MVRLIAILCKGDNLIVFIVLGWLMNPFSSVSYNWREEFALKSRFFPLRLVLYKKGGKYFHVKKISLWGISIHCKIHFVKKQPIYEPVKELQLLLVSSLSCVIDVLFTTDMWRYPVFLRISTTAFVLLQFTNKTSSIYCYWNIFLSFYLPIFAMQTVTIFTQSFFRGMREQ